MTQENINIIDQITHDIVEFFSDTQNTTLKKLIIDVAVNKLEYSEILEIRKYLVELSLKESWEKKMEILELLAWINNK